MAVFGLVSAVAGFVKVRYLIDKAVIDNMVFRMHYRITSAILFLCCIIVTANNLIGKILSFNFCRVCQDLSFLLHLENSRNPWKSSRNTIEKFSYVAIIFDFYRWLLKCLQNEYDYYCLSLSKHKATKNENLYLI